MDLSLGTSDIKMLPTRTGIAQIYSALSERSRWSAGLSGRQLIGIVSIIQGNSVCHRRSAHIIEAIELLGNFNRHRL